MSLLDLVRVLRRRFAWVVGGAVIGVLLAGALTLVLPKSYTSSTTLYVTATDSSDAGALSQGAMYVQNQLRSYPTLVTAPAVLEAAARETGVDQATLRTAVSAQVPTDSALLIITTSADSGNEAATIAASVAKHFSAEVIRLESRPGARESPIRVSTVAEAWVPPDPTSPSLRTYLPIGFAGGLLLGFLVGLAREQTSR